MALKQIKVTIKGIAPLILHNGQMADPLNPLAKQMKQLTVKRGKTDADQQLISDLEWLACWYLTDNQLEIAMSGNKIVIGDHGAPILPAHVLDAVIVNGAKKSKLGMQFKSGVFVEDDAVLILEPKKSLTEMFSDPNFRIRTMETVARAKVPRTRPYMKNWQALVTINYDDTVVNKAQIEQALENAGRLVGVCERRPKFGRFVFE